MNIIAVWMLVIVTQNFTTHSSESVTMIDNISTGAECARVQRVVKETSRYIGNTRCIEVIKVK